MQVRQPQTEREAKHRTNAPQRPSALHQSTHVLFTRSVPSKCDARQVVGFKVGCTSAAIRTQLGLKESVHGYLWDSEQHQSGCVLSSRKFYGIAIEGELAVRLLSMPSLTSPGDWDVEYFPTIELHHGQWWKIAVAFAPASVCPSGEAAGIIF